MERSGAGAWGMDAIDRYGPVRQEELYGIDLGRI